MCILTNPLSISEVFLRIVAFPGKKGYSIKVEQRKRPPGRFFLRLSKKRFAGFFSPTKAPLLWGPLFIESLRSPEMRAPCTLRRTCGAAQKGRGCAAARVRLRPAGRFRHFPSRAAAPPVSTGVRFSAIHLPKIYWIPGAPAMPCTVGQNWRVTVFFPAHVREKTFMRKSLCFAQTFLIS